MVVQTAEATFMSWSLQMAPRNSRVVSPAQPYMEHRA
jgi:hypothetical protein